MSSIKCIGAMAALGATTAGGLSLYKGLKAKKAIVANAEHIANANGGKIPTGGMTKDGKLWDGFTTVDKIKKDSNKAIGISSTISAIAGGISTAVIAGLTLLAKAKIK